MKKLFILCSSLLMLTLCLSSCDERADVFGDSQIVKGESIKSGYKVVVKNFTKEESHGEFRMSENEDVDIDSKRFI